MSNSLSHHEVLAPHSSHAIESTLSRLCFEILLLLRCSHSPEKPALHRAEGFPEEEGRDRLSYQRLDPLLQLGHFLGVLVGEVGLLRRILRQVEEFDPRRQRRSPHQLPVPLAQGGSASASG